MESPLNNNDKNCDKENTHEFCLRILFRMFPKGSQSRIVSSFSEVKIGESKNTETLEHLLVSFSKENRINMNTQYAFKVIFDPERKTHKYELVNSPNALVKDLFKHCDTIVPAIPVSYIDENLQRNIKILPIIMPLKQIFVDKEHPQFPSSSISIVAYHLFNIKKSLSLKNDFTLCLLPESPVNYVFALETVLFPTTQIPRTLVPIGTTLRSSPSFSLPLSFYTTPTILQQYLQSNIPLCPRHKPNLKPKTSISKSTKSIGFRNQISQISQIS